MSYRNREAVEDQKFHMQPIGTSPIEVRKLAIWSTR